MTTKFVAAMLFVTATACGGGGSGTKPTTPETPVAKEEPAPVEPTPEPAKPAQPAFALAIGEAVIYDGAEPGFKLHADGTSEVSAKVSKQTGKGKKKKMVTSIEWKAGPTFKADGTIEMDGKAVGKLGWDGVTDLESGKQMMAYKLDGDTVTVTGSDGAEVKLQIVPEGIKVVGGPMDGRVDKIDAADDKVKVTAMLIMVVNAIGGKADAPPDKATAGPAPTK